MEPIRELSTRKLELARAKVQMDNPHKCSALLILLYVEAQKRTSLSNSQYYNQSASGPPTDSISSSNPKVDFEASFRLSPLLVSILKSIPSLQDQSTPFPPIPPHTSIFRSSCCKSTSRLPRIDTDIFGCRQHPTRHQKTAQHLSPPGATTPTSNTTSTRHSLVRYTSPQHTTHHITHTASPKNVQPSTYLRPVPSVLLRRPQ